jgi:hypothetical protein
MKAKASHHPLLDSTRIAKATSRLRSTEYGLLFLNEVVLGWCPYHHHFPYLWLWDSEQDDKGAGHQGGAPTRQADDAMDLGGLQRCRQAHRW